MNNTKSTNKDVVTSGKDRRISWTFIPSFSTALLVVYFIISLLMNGDMTPLTRRGFFCNDSSINKPFHQDTIGVKTLFFIALLLPGITIKICDKSFNRLFKKYLAQNLQSGSKLRLSRKCRKVSDDMRELDLEEEELISSPITIKRRNLIPVDSFESDLDNTELELSNNTPTCDNEKLAGDNELENRSNDEETDLLTRVPLDSDPELYDSDKQVEATADLSDNSSRAFGEFQLFFFGLCTTMLFTGIGKVTCGRLRPHFIQRCQPDIKCSELEIANKYIEEFTCTNTELRPRDYSYITTSWPSGHASIMFYSMFYLIFYLNNVIPVLVKLNSKKVKSRYDPLVMYAIYVLLIALAGFIAMTRIFDYHHHPLDVASGSILGSFIAFVVAKTLSRQYSRHFIHKTHLRN